MPRCSCGGQCIGPPVRGYSARRDFLESISARIATEGTAGESHSAVDEERATRRRRRRTDEPRTTQNERDTKNEKTHRPTSLRPGRDQGSAQGKGGRREQRQPTGPMHHEPANTTAQRAKHGGGNCQDTRTTEQKQRTQGRTTRTVWTRGMLWLMGGTTALGLAGHNTGIGHTQEWAHDLGPRHMQGLAHGMGTTTQLQGTAQEHTAVAQGEDGHGRGARWDSIVEGVARTTGKCKGRSNRRGKRRSKACRTEQAKQERRKAGRRTARPKQGQGHKRVQESASRSTRAWRTGQAPWCGWGSKQLLRRHGHQRGERVDHRINPSKRKGGEKGWSMAERRQRRSHGPADADDERDGQYVSRSAAAIWARGMGHNLDATIPLHVPTHLHNSTTEQRHVGGSRRHPNHVLRSSQPTTNNYTNNINPCKTSNSSSSSCSSSSNNSNNSMGNNSKPHNTNSRISRRSRTYSNSSSSDNNSSSNNLTNRTNTNNWPKPVNRKQTRAQTRSHHPSKYSCTRCWRGRG